MVTLVAVAGCPICGWSQSGEPAAVDKAAERHGIKEHHPTSCAVTPVMPSDAHDGTAS